jgi:acetyltransferase-like isoleucine patch superfamily enzyme
MTTTPKTEVQKKLTDVKESSLKRYLDFVVGKGSILSLVKYELITSIFGPIPGAIGLFARRYLFRYLLGTAGNNITFGRNITIRHPKKIRIGDNTVIDDYAVLDAKGAEGTNITIGNDVIFGRNTTLSCKGGRISIGNNTNIGINTAIYSGSNVTIGSNALLAASCYIFGDGAHRSDRTDIPIIQQGQEESLGIVIEDGAWLGAGVTILDGVTIGRDSIIGAGAVVTNSIPPFSIALGMPAKVVKSRK